MNLKSFVRDIPDFPKKGIVFKDITPIFRDAQCLSYLPKALAEPWQKSKIDVVVGAEARGFLIGPSLAEKLGVGFVPVRKPGKLPAETLKHSYQLEYGSDSLEMHLDGVKKGERVLMVDDLLATGGTMMACAEMVKKLGGTVVGASFIIELSFLKGRQKLTGMSVHSLIQYDS